MKKELTDWRLAILRTLAIALVLAICVVSGTWIGESRVVAEQRGEFVALEDRVEYLEGLVRVLVLDRIETIARLAATQDK